MDAICIDQSNVQERGHQVAFMAKIYSMAECDILWLGDDPNDDAETTFKFIQHIGHIFKNLPAEGKERTKALRAASSVLGEDAPIAPLQRIMNNRPIWRRIWIVQEIVVARKVSLQCGVHSMSWDSLTTFLNFMLLRNRSLWQQPGALPLFAMAANATIYGMEIDTARICHKHGEPSSIFDLWSQFYCLQATDPRDKIYALLGLAAPTPLGLNSDYTKAPSEIFTMAVRSDIYQTKKLDALCIGHRQQANMALPTWVVDFGSCAAMRNSSLVDPPYLASGKTDVSPETFMHPALHPGTLVVSGVQLDTISKRLYTITSDDGLQSWLDLKRMVQNIPQDILKHRYHTGESTVEALARTITGDLSLGPVRERQRKQESKSLSRDIKSILSWPGRLRDQLENLLPHFIGRLIPGCIEKRERRQPYALSLLPRFGYHSLISSTNNYIAMVPNIAQEGDFLCVLYGSRLPHVMRKVPGKEDTYTLVGTAYVHGFMYGEAIQWRDQRKLKERRFNLI